MPTTIPSALLRADTAPAHPMSALLESHEDEGSGHDEEEAVSRRALDDSTHPPKAAVVFTTDVFVSMDVFIEVPEDCDEAHRYLGKSTHTPLECTVPMRVFSGILVFRCVSVKESV